MKYGYFDGPNREYVITRPDTPASWCNYLGTPAYGAVISNNAAGYSFVESGAMGRIMRFRFNSVPMDQPGRYIYLRDAESGDFWSGSWQPVGKDLKDYKSECRHGTGYTTIKSEYAGIQTETLYYVPMEGLYEVWNCKVKNVGGTPRKLALTGFVEFTSDSNYEQDQVNMQYTYFTTRTYFRDKFILQAINENCAEAGVTSSAGTSDERAEGIYRYFGAAGETVASYEGDRDIFLGDYRDYKNPIAIERGSCSNVLNYNKNSCGALQFDIVLQPGEEKCINFVFGAGGNDTAAKLVAKYEDMSQVAKDLQAVKDFWYARLNRLQIETPDENFNHMINMWNSYQCLLTFIWSRTASFQYCGQRNGLGYRDTVQDIQGTVHIDPELSRERLELMLSAQVDNGGGLPLVPWGYKPHTMGTPDDEDYVKATHHPYYRADDALWLFPTVHTYINETGNYDFLNKVIPFSNNGEGTVYEHLRRAIQFNLDRQGVHGLPAGLHADWNDCLRLGNKGESSFVAFQLYLGITYVKQYALRFAKSEDVVWCDKLLARFDETFQKDLWNEDRFVRGITEDGYVVGHRDNDEGSMWLNPQSWAVISGAAKESQGEIAMDSVYKNLNTKYGAMLLFPSFQKYGLPVARMALMNPGTKENGAIFSQSQGWLLLAETMLGHGNRAFEYYKEFNPASMNDTAEIRKIEPYAHGQSIEGTESPFHGRGTVHWLTGTASTVMVGMVYGILGLQPDEHGMRINPCIPSDWSGFTMKRIWRGFDLNITVYNPSSVEKGVNSIIVNGLEIRGGYFKADILKGDGFANEIKVVMG
ncbi:MAG: N,N'-diacetylchitobiose phosphorylase [Clostridia bacterium]